MRREFDSEDEELSTRYGAQQWSAVGFRKGGAERQQKQ